jgi:hypothetical protein
MVASIETAVFLDVIPCVSENWYQRFGRICCCHLQVTMFLLPCKFRQQVYSKCSHTFLKLYSTHAWIKFYRIQRIFPCCYEDQTFNELWGHTVATG